MAGSPAGRLEQLALADPEPALRVIRVKAGHPVMIHDVLLTGGQRTRVTGRLYGLTWHLRDTSFRAGLYLDFYNRRVILRDFEPATAVSGKLLEIIEELALSNNLDKIAATVEERNLAALEEGGWIKEAVIPGFYSSGPACLVTKFLSRQRATSRFWDKEEELMLIIKDKEGQLQGKNPAPGLPEGLTGRPAGLNDCADLAALYHDTFASYPTPLEEEDYLRFLMRSGYAFRLVARGEAVVAAAGAEIDLKNSAAELTDCATRPEFRGQGLMQHLLCQLENDLTATNIRTAFTLARATSAGMNAAFWRLGFSYAGRLVNNCHIAGGFEDLNVWYKNLRANRTAGPGQVL